MSDPIYKPGPGVSEPTRAFDPIRGEVLPTSADDDEAIEAQPPGISNEFLAPRLRPGNESREVTRRDRFALAAVTGRIACGGIVDIAGIAAYAWQVADAMERTR